MGKLEDLLVDEDALDRDALGAGLGPYLKVGKTGTLRPADGWRNLTQRDRVLAVLLGIKAGHVLGVRDHEEASATEVTEQVGAAGGTVRPILRGLMEAGFIAQGRSGAYFVPAMAVPRAVASLGAGGRRRR